MRYSTRSLYVYLKLQQIQVSSKVMMECHYCSQPFEKVDLSSIAKCCIKRCNKYYCVECIKKHFNPEFDMQMYRKDTWICYSCQSVCLCDKCKKPQKTQKPQKLQKIQSINHEKKSNKQKKAGRPKVNADESIELSGSNISQNNIKNEGANLPNLQQQEANMMVDEQDEQDAVQDEPLPDFKLYSEDQMYQFLPFYRKIAQRRNKFYTFILKECRKKKQISKQYKQKINWQGERNE